MPAGQARVVWHGDKIAAELQTALYRGLQQAAAFGRAKVIEVISRPSRTGGGGRRRPGRGKNKGKPMRFNRSRPGQPPKRDTGKLVQSIFWSSSRAQMMAVVGTKKKYGVALEKGANIPARVPTRKRFMVWGLTTAMQTQVSRGAGGRFVAGRYWMFAKHAAAFRLAPRPYILVTLKRHKARIEQLIFAQGKKVMSGGVSFG